MATPPARKKPAPPKTTKPAALKKRTDSATLALVGEIEAAALAGYPYYVYTLADGLGVFYVGKGKGRRLFQHEALSPSDSNTVKKARIRACGIPHKTILAYFSAEASALAFEAELIRQGGEHLTNISGGTVTSAQLASARALSLLDGMPGFHEWMARLSPQKMVRVATLGGSARGFYERIRDGLRAEVASPTPTRVFIPFSPQFLRESHGEV